MISYAQNHEDVLLARCFGERSDGFFIDVGAWDPVEHSVTHHFSELGWHGINVEPSQEYYDRLVASRPQDINLQCLVGDTEGTTTFTVLAGSGLSTARHIEGSFLHDLEQGGYPSVEVDMPIHTLATICAQHLPEGTEVDFLKIDVEGYESKAIHGADWQSYRPKVVLVEAMQPVSFNLEKGWADVRDTSGEWEPQLLRNGYVFAAFDGLNRYYIRCEDTQLVDRLATPVNIFDEYVPYESVVIRALAERLQNERAELDERLAGAEGELQRVSAELARLRELERNLEADRNAFHARIGDLEQQIESLRTSTSWRLTAPLRAASRLIIRRP